jgi:hypothetical protein
MKIQSVNGFQFCPFCGDKLEREEISVGRGKKNLVVRCPEHGSLHI